jgi:hypothetical protein
LLPGIVLRELVIKQSATVCVLSIILKKGYQGQTGIRGFYGQLFKREVVCKTDCVLPWQVNRQVLNRRKLLMRIILEQAPECLCQAYVPCLNIAGDLVIRS